MPSYSLIYIVFLPFLGSFISALIPNNARKTGAWLTGSIALSCVILLIFYTPFSSFLGMPWKEIPVVRYEIPWLPQYDINFIFRLDGFAWLIALIVSGIGALIALYAYYYMSAKDPVARFYSFLLAFMGSMLGVVLSGNLIQLVFFWELTSLFSFLLIGYWYHNSFAREGARLAFLVTGLGGLCLLAGILILGYAANTFDLDVLILPETITLISESPYIKLIIILVSIGALTKSAQFPFHFWLPSAMAAPTPVSSYLHSATMVKAGVFLLARLWPILGHHDLWFLILCTSGICSFIGGGYIALFQRDTKGLLAYSTISHLGLITVLLSLGSSLAAIAAVFHILNHATFKASLFMAAGIIDHETGTRDINKLSGLRFTMPITATLAMVASAAMAGVPLLNGFLSKEMFFAESIKTFRDVPLDHALPYLATLGGMFSIAYALRFSHGVFFGVPATNLPKEPHDPPFWMLVPVLCLVFICFIIGIVPSATVAPILKVAVPSLLGESSLALHYSLKVWHGFNLALVMSFISLFGGIFIYWLLLSALSRSMDIKTFLPPISGKTIFETLIITISWRWARFINQKISSTHLQTQIRIIVICGFIIAFFAYRPRSSVSIHMTDFDISLGLIWLTGALCAVFSAYSARFHRLSAIIFMGGAGLATCFTFLWFSAPDVALTQLLVEIVTTILLLLGLRWLPPRSETMMPKGSILEVRGRRFLDTTLACIVGLGVGVLAYHNMTREHARGLADYFIRNAYSEGGGSNVVNVLLVDFRGFDTLGEISVLGVVSLAVFALLRRFRPAYDSIKKPLQQIKQDDYDIAHPDRKQGDTIRNYLYISSVLMQFMFPFIIIFGFYLFIRGHDAPGGGFTAGLSVAIAFVLQYMAGGTVWIESRILVAPRWWISLGILSSLFTGLGALLFSKPFLTSYSTYLHLPILGKIPFATALFFDLGVYLLVVGTTIFILIALAHQSIRVSNRVRERGEGE